MKWRRWITLPRRGRAAIARDVDDELAFHLRAREDDLVADGVPRDVAHVRAAREFGDVDDARRYATAIDVRTEAAAKRRELLDALRLDVTYALRRLRRAPGFSAVALATLAVGIGTTTGIFSVVNSVLLRPLPFPEPTQLVRVWSANRTAGSPRAGVSAMDLDDWRAQRRLIADVGGFWYSEGASGLDLADETGPQRLSTVFVTPGFFSTMRVTPLHGRLPREDELVRGGPDRFILLSHAFWQRQFGGRADLVGRTLSINQEQFTVIGILPPGMAWPAPNADAFASFSIFTDEQVPRLRFVRVLSAVARLRPDVSVEAAGAELQDIAKRLAERYPENRAWDGATVMPLRDAITGDVSGSLWAVLGAVAMLLLIACVNVASLQLARATARRAEVSVRAALGATRGRIVRHLLTESVVLALMGGALGLGVAVLTVRGVVQLSSGQLPRDVAPTLDGTMLGGALVLALVTGILAGLTPAWRSARDLQSALRGGRGSAGPVALRLRHALVVAEVALAMALVVGGGLMVRSYRTLGAVDLGFDPRQLLTLRFSLSTDRHGDRYQEVYAAMLNRVRAVPGVIGAAAVSDAPLRSAGEEVTFTTPGMTVPAGEQPPGAALLQVSDRYFEVMRTRLIAGREFAPTDRADAPPVVIVNQAFARRWFPGETAVGKRLSVFGRSSVEIVGVVADMRQQAVATDPTETVYVHEQQLGRVRVNLMVRTQGAPLAQLPALRAAMHEVDPLQAITAVFTMDDAVRDALARPRLVVTLLGAYGVMGLLLGAIGLYGVLAYLVQQRRKDIGIRMALGAARTEVVGMIVGHGLRLTLWGVGIGVILALGFGRALAGVLYGVGAADPGTYAAVAVVLLVTALVASWLPARRAAAVDVVTTLRQE